VIRVAGPAEDIATIWDALSAGADQLRAVGHVETLDQGRFDTALSWATDFLRSQHLPVPGGRPVGIQLIVKHSTATGADNDPAHLVGHGPITAQAARDLIFGVPPRPGPFDFPDRPGGPADSSPDLTAEAVEASHVAGKQVIVWTPDRRTDQKVTIDTGVDGVISNWPACTLALEGRDHPAPGFGLPDCPH
jgi:hypothetical protein